MSLTQAPREARTILYVDDEPMTCKNFARLFSDEFTVLTAQSVQEALSVISARRDEVAILMTDYAMPVSTGLDLLKIMRRDYKSVFCILTTAYAALDMAIEAVNEGQVYKILPKPIDCVETRLVLREALALHSTQAREKALHENRAQAMRETLAFLAHEINTPMTTVRGYTSALLDWHRPAPPDAAAAGLACFAERRPGVVLSAIAACERSALYCQSLVSTFVQSARDAYPGRMNQLVSAGSLIKALLEEYPFEKNERAWISCSLTADFLLPSQRDLFYLALCTLTKNAIFALQDTEKPCLQIVLGYDTQPHGPNLPWVSFVDNGPGIAPEILGKLTHEPVTTHEESGGNGMGLIFCRRLMLSLGGSVDITSEPGRGATVTLRFQPLPSVPSAEANAEPVTPKEATT